MSDKKVYTKTDFDNYAASVRSEYEKTLLAQRERIDELKTALATAESKLADAENKKDLVYRAITAALKKADDIERVSLIRYNQEIAQLKSFHDKWVGYFNKIIAQYPLSDELVEASKVNGRIAEVLSKADDGETQYETERAKLKASLDSEREEAAESKETAAAAEPDYADRSPAGFSISEALHPKEDLKDIMRELGVLIDD